MITTRLVSDKNGFHDLKRIWSDIEAADSKATLFNSWSWIEAWLEVFGDGVKDLAIHVVERDGRPVALVPLYYCPARRSLLFLGTGEPEEEEVGTEYVDLLLIDDEAENHELRSFIVEMVLRAHSAPILLRNCVPGSHIHACCHNQHRVLARVSGRQYRLALSKEVGEEFLFHKFSSNNRKKSRQALNRFRKDGELKFSLEERRAHPQYWAVLEELHQSTWRARGKPGAFASERFNTFHRLMHERHPNVTQLFTLLRYREEVLAIHHYYVHRDVAYFYQAGMDKTRYQRVSPGHMLHVLSILQLAGRVRWYDFMKGSVDGSYKKGFTSGGAEFLDLIVYGRGWRGAIGYQLARGRESLREVSKRSISPT